MFTSDSEIQVHRDKWIHMEDEGLNANNAFKCYAYGWPLKLLIHFCQTHKMFIY